MSVPIDPLTVPVAAGPGPARRRHLQRQLRPRALTPADGRSPTAEIVLHAWWEGKATHTVRSYRHDLEDFAAYLTGALRLPAPVTVVDALTRLWGASSPAAHAIALGFRAHLRAADLSPASINRHLATLRSVTTCARVLGRPPWALEVGNVPAEARRPVHAPAAADVRRLLAATGGETAAATRNAAIVTLLYCLGLRVSELCGLTLDDLDLTGGVAWIRGKGRHEREAVPLPAPVVGAIRRYLRWRGPHRGPLVQGTGGRRRALAHRLSPRSVLRIVRRLGRRVGLDVGCHSLRHSSITQAAACGAQVGLGLDTIRAHSRHRAIGTLMLYVHAQRHTVVQRTLADLLAGTLTTDEHGRGAPGCVDAGGAEARRR